jgi:hypothetical protein
MTDEQAGPSLTLHDGLPTIIDAEGNVRHTVAPQLFDTGGGIYLAYAEGWREALAVLYPNGWESAAEAAASEFGLTVSPEPSLWLLVAMTLEP